MQEFLLPIVLVSGFLDGIHPCAIAVLLFFIAFLLSIKRERNYIFATGGTFIIGVFLAYLGIGLGIVGVFSFFPAHFMAKLGASLLFAVGSISLIEGIFKKKFFKMPKFVVPKIESSIRQATLPAALIAGFVVGLCAFPCAGGIYVAIMGLVASQSAGLAELAYLVLYNIMFVAPLILLLAVASNKALLEMLEQFEKKSRSGLKIALGEGAILLALYIFLSVL
ncbi:MAG: GAP family protein [Candidatus Micrarchaeota archaeon]